ncbi:nucleotide exchange factor GrpE [Metabacillus arenae]|uniref:Protein GrpE n=1 Tax=Metabacillus arenae TaxID=2771434 RepID=A0A926NI39_9BACI|nr:nucleotide exchange factor GrpE [Metabacillus arenae]MBD1382089.1 nucleotide exchange factor GrpE [Metabacillus arenae]
MADEKQQVETQEAEEEREKDTSLNEEPEAADVQEVSENELEEAQAKIAELESKLEESDNRMVRLQADYENFKRRTRLDQEASQKYRAQSLITELLPALDNFERALQIETDDDKTQSVLQGVEMVYRQLLQAIQNEGVEAIEAVGQQFDPHLHQAVMQVEDENFESNTVIEEFQKGYKLKDRVIRPTMVKVNQ